MPTVKTKDIPEIAEAINNLTIKSDNRRLGFSDTMLTIYTIVTSGLVALSSSIVLGSILETISFLVIVVSSVFIVILALIERFGYFLISNHIAATYAKHVNDTGEPLRKQLSGKKWQSRLVNMQTYLILITFLINMIAVLVFIFTRVLP